MSSLLSDGWGEFLSGFLWDWYVTLTFAGDVKSFTAHHRCEAWLKSLDKAAGQSIIWFRGDEYGERFGKFHMHLLIGGAGHLHRFTWMNRWQARNGFARILPFDSAKGAAYYVSKYVTKQFGEWDIGGDIEAFQIQQSNLPLIGQRGWGNNRDLSITIDSKPTQEGQLVGTGRGDIDTNRIQQSILPLTDQPGTKPDLSIPNDSKPTQKRRPVRTGHQLPISDFKEPDLREFETDPIQLSFLEQTERRR